MSLVRIRNTGGDVYYHFRFDEMDKLLPNPTQPEPSWLRYFLGDDFFARVCFVDFLEPSTHVTDDIVPHVARLAGLRKLRFMNSSVTDAGLIELRNLTELEDLLFRGETITDKDTASCRSEEVEESLAQRYAGWRFRNGQRSTVAKSKIPLFFRAPISGMKDWRTSDLPRNSNG